jgi:hypothetical protein
MGAVLGLIFVDGTEGLFSVVVSVSVCLCGFAFADGVVCRGGFAVCR